MQVPTGGALPTADGRVQMYPCFAFEFHLVLIAIDPDLGRPEIRRYLVGHDCGTVINPKIVRGMTMGGIAHGIGAALFEEFAYNDEGQLIAQNFMDYLLPSSHEVPEVEIVHHVTPSPLTVLGQKGSGESGYLGAPAAIASAVNDALRPLGIAVSSLPIKIAQLGDLIAAAREQEAEERAKRRCGLAAPPAPCGGRLGEGELDSESSRMPAPRPCPASGGGDAVTLVFLRGVRMIIDTHGHLVPPELLSAIRKERARFPSLRLIEDGGSLALAFAGGKPSRPIMKGLSDVAGRIAWMDRQGIDRQVVGSWPDWFGYELPAAEGEAWCRLINDAQLAAARAEPRFVPLAVVPLQDGARAAAVLKSAMAAGFPGLDDRHLAARDRQRARRRRPRAVLGGGGRDRRRRPHPSELRRRRRAGERLWPRQRGREGDRCDRGGGAAPVQRTHHALPQRPHLRSDRRCRAAVRARTARAQLQDHAGDRRSGGRARTALHRQHRARSRGCCDLSWR